MITENSNSTLVKEQARKYIGRGWSVLPINPRDKQCFLPEWSKLRIKESQLDEYFLKPNSNIGLLLGEASEGLTDIDLTVPKLSMWGRNFYPTRSHPGAVATRRTIGIRARASSPTNTRIQTAM